MKKRPTSQKESQAPRDSGIVNQVATQLALPFPDSAMPMVLALPPRYPRSRDSVIAHMLVMLLEGRHLTSDDIKTECGSGRAAHHAHALSKNYKWPIQTEPWHVGTKDGRLESIVRYFLEPTVVAQAFAFGAKEFMQETRRARAKLQMSAPEKYRHAQLKNSARLNCALP